MTSSAVASSVGGTVRPSACAVLRLWEVQSGRLLRTLQDHTKIVSALAVSLDGRRIVSGSWDKTIKIWEAESGRLLPIS
jgi:WD40 repeat protein